MIKPRFDKAYAFRGKLAVVQLASKRSAYIDRRGKIVWRER